MVIKNGQLVVYQVKEDYLGYLSQFDKNVRQKSSRRYTGILITNNNQDYCIPLTCIVKKRSDKLTINIKDNDEVIAQLTLNNMIPVNENNLKIVNIYKDKDKDYLNKEIQYLRNPKVLDSLISKVENMMNVLLLPQHKDYKFFKELCTNYILLEEKCKEYNNK